MRSLQPVTMLSIAIITTLLSLSLIPSVRSDTAMDDSLTVDSSLIKTCPLNPCLGWSRFNFTCSHSGCTEVPLDEIQDDIEAIYLNNNEISSINVELSFKYLEHLDLSSNNISIITRGAFEKLIRLVTLNMADNKLTNDTMLPDLNLFATLTKLQRLDLSGNLFESLYDNMFSISPPVSSLLYLNVSHNRISTMTPNAVNDFQSLTVLDLSNNQLKSLHPLQFRGLQRIQHISVAKNQLTDIPQIGSLTTLERLDLSDNRIAVINSTAFTEKRRMNFNLKVLDLSRNRLVALDQRTGILPLVGLTDIYLDGNEELTQITDGVFYISYSLSVISVTNCPSLTMIGRRIVSPRAHDVRVNISRNKNLKFVHPDAFSGAASRNVVELDLSGNSLVTLSADLVNWTSLRSVDLGGNEWDCDCHLRWMKDVQNVPVTNGSNFTQNLICHTPLHLRGYNFNSLDDSALRCGVVNRYRRHGAILLALSFSVLFLAVIVLLWRRCRHRLRARWFTSVSKYEPLRYNASEATSEGAEGPEEGGGETIVRIVRKQDVKSPCTPV